MSQTGFVGYVGDADIHDGSIIEVEPRADRVMVRLAGASGRRYVVEFHGVERTRSNKAEGMRLYALVEMEAPAPLRRFVFANWDEEDDACLEVVASEFRLSPEERSLEKPDAIHDHPDT